MGNEGGASWVLKTVDPATARNARGLEGKGSNGEEEGKEGSRKRPADNA